MSDATTKKMMKSSMPFKAENSKLPSTGPTQIGSDSRAIGMKSGGSVKRMPTTMARKPACGC